MSQEIPLYQGHKQEISEVVPRPIQTPDVISRATDIASQNASNLLTGAVEAYGKIQDSRGRNTQEKELRTIQMQHDTDLQRRFQIAAGKTGSMYREDGSINEQELNNAITETEKKVRNISPSFFNPLSGELATQQREAFASSIKDRTYALATKYSNQAARQALGDNYNLAVQTGDWGGASDILNDATQAGIMSQTQAALKHLALNRHRYTLDQKATESNLSGLIQSDPKQAFEAINNGDFDNLDPSTLNRLKDSLRKDLSVYAEPEPLNEQEQATIANGGTVKQRSKPRFGATEEEWKWHNNYLQTGSYDAHKEDITKRWNEELEALPVPKTEAEAKQIANSFIKKWAGSESGGGYGVEPNNLTLRVEDRLAELMGKVNTSNRNDIDLAIQFIPDGILTEKLDSWYLWSSVEEETDKLAKTKATLSSNVKNSMAQWRIEHPDAKLSEDRAQIFFYAATYAKDSGGEAIAEPAKTAKEINLKLADKDLREQNIKDRPELIKNQEEKRREYLETHPAASTKQLEMRYEGSKPIENTVSHLDMNGEEGAYVSRETYQELEKTYGDNIYAKVAMKKSGAFARIPIVGAYEGEDQGIIINGDSSSLPLLLLKGDTARGNIRFYDGTRDHPTKPNPKPKRKKKQNTEPVSYNPDETNTVNAQSMEGWTDEAALLPPDTPTEPGEYSLFPPMDEE